MSTTSSAPAATFIQPTIDAPAGPAVGRATAVIPAARFTVPAALGTGVADGDGLQATTEVFLAASDQALYTLAITKAGSDERDHIDITRLNPAPAVPDVKRAEQRALTAMARHAALAGFPAAAVRALVRSTVAQAELLDRLGSAADLESSTDGEALLFPAGLNPFAVLTAPQPRSRSKGRAAGVADPGVTSTPQGLTVYTYDSPEHLRQQQTDNVRRSLGAGLKRKRHHEIIATGVRRPVLAEVARIEFRDGTPAQWAVFVRDGITRLSVELALLLDLTKKSPLIAAEKIGQAMVPVAELARLRGRPAAGDSTQKVSRTLIEAGMKAYKEQAKVYAANVDPDENPTAEGLLIRQAGLLPARVAVRAFTSTGVMAHVKDAMTSLVADQHTGTESWESEDESLFNVERALDLAVERRVSGLGQDVVDLFVGRVPYTDVDEVFMLSPAPNRAGVRYMTSLFATLTHPDRYEGVKAALRAKQGQRSVYWKGYIGDVAPLANQHWADVKPMGKIWGYAGGPAPEQLVRRGITLRHPEDYLTLVAAAVAGDVDARAELCLAGGAALMSDGYITTAIIGGSGGAKSKLVWRGQPDELLRLLSSAEEGLTQLALAANAFDPAVKAVKAWVPLVDLDDPQKTRRDGIGTPLRLTEPDLAAMAAAAEAALKAAAADGGGAGSASADGDSDDPADDDITAEERLERLVESVPGAVARVAHLLEEIETVRTEAGMHGPAFSAEDVATLSNELMAAAMTLGRLAS